MVVEFQFKPKYQCITPIGRYTGLESVKNINCWYPSKDCHPERNCEGYYFLCKLPEFENGDLNPCALYTDSAETLKKTIAEVRREFTGSNKYGLVRDTWQKWYDIFPPETDNINEYIHA
jgi:hypothetical protein